MSFAANLARPEEAVALLGMTRHLHALRPEPALAAMIQTLERVCVIRPATGAPALFVFGDSHAVAMFGNYPGIHDIHYGASTMHAIGRDGLDLLRPELFGVQDGDEVVFLFGEIDARIHIARQRDDHGRAPEDVIAILVQAYLAAIDAKAASYRNLGVTVAAVLPPSNDSRLLSSPEMRPVGSIEDRVGFTQRLNQMLRTAVERRAYRFLDLYGLYGAPDGTLPPAITIDGLHVGTDARFLAIHALGALIGRSI